MQTSYQLYPNVAIAGTKDSTDDFIVDRFAALSAIPIGTAVVFGASADTTPFQVSCVVTNGSKTVTPSAVTNIVSGQLITGPGIPFGTLVDVVSVSTFTMTQAAVVSATTPTVVCTFGTTAAQQVVAYPTVKPPTGAGGEVFAGIALLQEGSEQSLSAGAVAYAATDSVPVASFGRVWGKCDPALAAGAIAYGDPVYFIPSGANAGCFTNVVGSNVLVSNAKFRSTLSITPANGAVAIVAQR